MQGPPPPAAAGQSQPAFYGLPDEQYGDWKRARAACRKDPGSLDSLRALAADRKLLNWKNPVDRGQTLLHELVAAGASEEVVKEAVDLGCDPAMPDSEGHTPQEQLDRSQSSASSWLAAAATSAPPPRRRSSRTMMASAAPLAQRAQELLAGMRRTSLRQPRNQPPPSVPPPDFVEDVSVQSTTGSRRKGLALKKNDVSSMPKAKINLDVDLCQEDDLDETSLQAAVQRTYGGSARVQIDDITEKSSNQAAGPQKRTQNLKCRVLFDSADEARSWQARSSSSRTVQEAIAGNMGLDSSAVQFDAPSKMDEVDAVTLKLDSDSSHILCGACLLYDRHDNCEKVVHYSDRSYHGGVVRHSGDTQVGGKSVHTISIVQSKIPANIADMYFTLCSCGPQDLSGFPNPSIMLYDHSEPDANLLEYTIGQAGKSPSCVMAQLTRRPKWSAEDRIAIACVLRRMRMPFFCLDLCLAMAAETCWDVMALGTEEWHLERKICCNYESCKHLIREKRRRP